MLVTLSLIFSVIVTGSDLHVLAKRVPAIPRGLKTASNVNSLQSLLLTKRELFSFDVRQQFRCEDPGDHPCANAPGFCAQPGWYCCSNGISCPDNANCYGEDQCCPKNAQTCGGRNCCQPSNICCNSDCFAGGHHCCKDKVGRACQDGFNCCTDTDFCCEEGSTCLENGECEIDGGPDPDPTPTTSFTTSTSMSTSTSKSTSSFTTEVSETISSESTSTSASSASSSPSSTTSSAATPTITFVYVAGLTDALVGNMCLGMQKRGKANIDTLTYDPTNKSSKRQAAGCVPGFCNYPTTGKSCDEYPFASTQEGGSGAQIGCVPAYQNTDQGIYLNSFRAFYNILPGQKFGVAIIGIDCTTVTSIAPPARARVRRDNISASGSNATVLPPFSFGDQTMNHVLMPFGDLEAGQYAVTVPVNAEIDSWLIVDGDGEQLAQNNGTSATEDTLAFTLADGGTSVGMACFTKSKNLNVTWMYNATTTPSTGSAVAVLSSIHWIWSSLVILLVSPCVAAL